MTVAIELRDESRTWFVGVLYESIPEDVRSESVSDWLSLILQKTNAGHDCVAKFVAWPDDFQ